MTQINENKKPTLLLENITKRFDKITAVSDISFSAYKGEIIALLGPNGAGKSTLMNMIAGYLSPSKGDIFVNGNDVSSNDLITKKDIGFLPEGAPMYADMSVKLFLEYIIELKLSVSDCECTKDIYLKELERIMSTAKIKDVAEQKIETLSKGYLRRVGFAQSIIGNPPILLLDEPTDGLDPNQKEHMRKLITDMKKDKTVIISTHLLDEAETIATRIILVNKGKIIADGSLANILALAHKKTLEEAFKTLTQTRENENEEY
ncbi:MAG: ABC transporter ATP-binding protein [Acetobacter sp.]|nr:ABC transporter ATP-binding protein [Acetobacter sp.]